MLCILLVLQLVAGQTYHRETIDSIDKSSAVRVEVEGIVQAVTLRQDKVLTFRIADEHGHSLGCIWPGSGRNQPRVGVKIKVLGVRHRFQILRTFGAGTETAYITEIDPVEAIDVD